MSLEAIYFVSQIVAAVAIVASLLFVALQLRQSDRTQQAMMHQLRAQRGMDLALRTMDDSLSQTWNKLLHAGETVTTPDIFKIAGLQRAMIQNLLDTVWQHKVGLLDQATYDYTIVPMRNMFSLPAMRALWLSTSTGYCDTHARLVNDLIIDGQPLREPVDLAILWRTVLSQLTAKTTDPAGQV